ncbi:MAG: phosphatidylglycerol lysyltransferase domain-containing protein [Patescibacteria group bacterium]
MVPLFPAFTYIGPEQLVDIQRITRGHPSYSDYNQVSLFSWDIHQNTLVSTLYGNLVVIFSDYVTSDRQVGLLGSSNLSKCISVLKGFLPSIGCGDRIHYVPHETAKSLEDSFDIAEDPDNHDYILVLDRVIQSRGKDYRNFRRKIKSFRAYDSLSVFQQIDLEEESQRSSILKVFSQRELSKDNDHGNELSAMMRLLKNRDLFEIEAYGLRIDDELQAFIIIELESDDMVVGHFWKANIEFSGIYHSLLLQTSKTLCDRGYKQMNIEQDLGIPGLRQSKKSLCPKILKKYSVTLA